MDVTFGSLNVCMVFPYPCLSFFPYIAVLLYPSNVPLFFTKTISFAAFNLNASFRICPSLVCRFLNRYDVLLSLFSSLISTFSLAFAHEERESFALNRPYLKSSPSSFISHTCRASFFIIFYQREAWSREDQYRLRESINIECYKISLKCE